MMYILLLIDSVLYIYLSFLFYCIFTLSLFFFFFKQKTAYEMRISDWSSDVCSSDLLETFVGVDQLDDGHRAEQEEENLRNFSQVMAQRFDHHRRGVPWVVAAGLQQRKYLVGAQHQNGPGHNRGQDRGSGLVYLQGMFKGYA